MNTLRTESGTIQRTMRKIGLQLYTVRETLKRDFAGTLRAIADIGYRGVEFAGEMGGYGPRELRRLLDDLGLHPIGGHVGINDLERSLERVLEYYAALGAPYVGVAWLPPAYRNAEGWLRAGRLMEAAAQTARRYGLTFHYHNHDFEFARLQNGQYGLDQLFNNTDPELVKAELDVYWAKKGGEDPVTYIRKLAGRIPLIHLKDMTADAAQTFACVGDGILDFPAIFAAADASGVDWYIVEQDVCPRGELESARRSYENMAARGWLG
jgi:sugar phosphate isomerase/epimerase